MRETVSNVVFISEHKKRFMESFMRKTPEEIYAELMRLNDRISQLNAEIYRLHQYIKETE
jgi:hypothetical protein